MFQAILLARTSPELSKLVLVLRDREFPWAHVLAEMRAVSVTLP